MINIRYISAAGDRSGYGAAARDYIFALLETNQVNLTLEVVSFEKEKTNLGEPWKKIVPHIRKQIDYDIQIIHLTPENFAQFKHSSKYNIGYAAWETTKLPSGWADLCNFLNEIWVPSDYCIEVFKNSGVVKPIFKVVHGIREPNLDAKPIPMGNEDTFAFYSIHQWIARKAPIPLLKAYLTEFLPEENVVLALKTYRLNSSIKEKQAIKEQIRAIKQSLNLSEYPRVLFFSSAMTEEEIQGLHKRGNCFILASRSEGFGIPIAEAMSYGNPVIASNYGGNLEFTTRKNSFLVDCQTTPVSGMIFSNYNGHMNWGDPDISQIKQHMRWIYEHQEEAKEVGLRGKETISKEFSWGKIGQVMVDRLKQIQNEITRKK